VTEKGETNIKNTNKKQTRKNDAKIKAAQTAFTVVEYDPQTDTTVLIARPVTGRSHQIRLHAKYLGHVIANDPVYNTNHDDGDNDSDNITWYGNPMGKEMCQRAKLLLENVHNTGKSVQKLCVPAHATSTDVPAVDDEIQQRVVMQPRLEGESMIDYLKKTCVWCARSGKNSILLEYLIRSPGIWLHSLQYHITPSDGKHLSYRTKDLPDWAQPQQVPTKKHYKDEQT